MSRIATGWCLAKDSWAALKADRSLAIGVIFRVELYRYATEGRVAEASRRRTSWALPPGRGCRTQMIAPLRIPGIAASLASPPSNRLTGSRMNSKRRRAVVVVVVAIAAVITAVLAPVGQAAKRGPTCKRAHSKTVAQNGAVRVFKIRRKGVTTLYACRKSTGRRSKLDKTFEDELGTQKGTFYAVRLRGNYVAWISSFTDTSCKAACPPGFEPTKLSIKVFHVRRRRTRTVDGSPIGSALVLSRNGAVAWCAQSTTVAAERQVRGSVRSGDDQLIDSGNIDPKSLAIEITIISWTRDSTEQFARLR